MTLQDHIKKNLDEMRMMQVASVRAGQPWICTVYFVADEQQNLYWLSLPERRHSQEISEHNKVAVAVPVKFDTQPVIGIQAEGSAEIVQDAGEVKKAMNLYVKKYNLGKDFYDNFTAGKNKHVLYKFLPRKFVLFDEMNYSGDKARQEWNI